MWRLLFMPSFAAQVFGVHSAKMNCLTFSCRLQRGKLGKKKKMPCTSFLVKLEMSCAPFYFIAWSTVCIMKAFCCERMKKLNNLVGSLKTNSSSASVDYWNMDYFHIIHLRIFLSFFQKSTHAQRKYWSKVKRIKDLRAPIQRSHLEFDWLHGYCNP